MYLRIFGVTIVVLICIQGLLLLFNKIDTKTSLIWVLTTMLMILNYISDLVREIKKVKQ